MAEENSKPYSALLRSTEEVLNFLNNPSSVDRHLRFKMLRLERVKQSLPIGDIRSCVDDIEQELKKLRQEGRPSLILLRSIDAAINFIDSPSVANRERQLSIAKEVGFHSWGRLLKGLLFCLAGVSFGVGIGLAAYFTGGTALLVSGPLMIKGIMLSAALVETGVAIAAGAAVASAPLITAGVCFFGKQPIRTKMEALVDCVDSDQRAVRISQV